MIDTLDLATLSGLRDRALLLVGFAGALRRSELVAIDLVDLSRRGDGYVVHLLRSKDDQEDNGRQVGLPAFSGAALCPVTALDAWLAAAHLRTGPVFRGVTRYQTVGRVRLSPAAVGEIVKRAARAAGLPAHRLSGHSLRAGHATTAAEHGAPDRTIMRQTGHRQLETLEGYIRPGNILRDNSARYLALDVRDTEP